MLNSSITNSNGIAVANVTLTETSNIYAHFDEITSKYPSSNSNTVQVEILTPLFAPKLDGTDNITWFNSYGQKISTGGILSCGCCTFDDGWDNTNNWTFECDYKINSDGSWTDIGALLLYPVGVHTRDSQNMLQLWGDHNNFACFHKDSTGGSNQIFSMSIELDTWYHIRITKTSSTTITLEINQQTYNITWNGLSNMDKITTGLDKSTSRDYCQSMKNIIVYSND